MSARDDLFLVMTTDGDESARLLDAYAREVLGEFRRVIHEALSSLPPLDEDRIRELLSELERTYS